MMRQYEEAKAACGDCILLFRMGDFYELFYEDAKTAARVLGLTLTSRDKGENPIPMAGFPHHQLEGYLGKLIRQGYRAAVCEQVEDPREAKGIVKREVTRIVTRRNLDRRRLARSPGKATSWQRFAASGQVKSKQGANRPPEKC
jgi:DNA mismatch repair protein MutS